VQQAVAALADYQNPVVEILELRFGDAKFDLGNELRALVGRVIEKFSQENTSDFNLV
jgi:hypothetical protein